MRRYPQHVAAQTKYYQRIDAFGTLGAYTNGANEQRAELTPYVPSLMSVPQDERTAEQVLDDSLDLKPRGNLRALYGLLLCCAATTPTCTDAVTRALVRSSPEARDPSASAQVVRRGGGYDPGLSLIPTNVVARAVCAS